MDLLDCIQLIGFASGMTFIIYMMWKSLRAADTASHGDADV